MKERIVVVEDDESIRILLTVALQSHGYQPVCFEQALPALADMKRNIPDLVIMDLMLDGMDGLTAVRQMRQAPGLRQVPVMVLTARDMEADKVIGLDAGADDYMTKPFGVLELCARVRALLRRAAGERPQSALYHCPGLGLDPEARELRVDGQVVELTYKEFELLKYLMEHPGKSLRREVLLREVWGIDYTGETRTLDIHIGTLRQKIGDPPERSRYIKTVRGVGYRFVGGVNP